MKERPEAIADDHKGRQQPASQVAARARRDHPPARHAAQRVALVGDDDRVDPVRLIKQPLRLAKVDEHPRAIAPPGNAALLQGSYCGP